MDLLIRLKLSIQRALLGNITPNIRSVFIDVNGNLINLYFYFDGAISTDDTENTSIIASEVIADFDAPFDIDEKIIRLDSPQPIESPLRYCVYLRKD